MSGNERSVLVGPVERVVFLMKLELEMRCPDCGVCGPPKVITVLFGGSYIEIVTTCGACEYQYHHVVDKDV